MRAYIPERKQTAPRNRSCKGGERQALCANGRRVGINFWRSLPTKGGELPERSFAACPEIGGLPAMSALRNEITR